MAQENIHEQQKLRKRNTYTPTDTSLVCSSVICPLNKEETLSETDSKTFLNNPEENQLVLCGSRTEVDTICCKNHISIKPINPLPNSKSVEEGVFSAQRDKHVRWLNDSYKNVQGQS